MELTPATFAALFTVAVVGGIINAVAGGGTFVVFPTLLLSGVPAIRANATNTVSLWPGVIFSLFAFRAEVRRAPHPVMLAVTSLAGGAVGAILLLRTPPAIFERSVPFLLLLATLMFACNPLVAKRLQARHGIKPVGPARLAATVVVIFFIAVYGGYFGGGIGLLILAALGLLGLTNFHDMNAFRLLLSCSANCSAVIAFIIAGAVAWPQAVVMLTGAILGGYVGAGIVKRLRANVLRGMVVAMGLSMSAYFFVRQLG